MFYVFIFIVLSSVNLWAASNQSIVYQGTILKPDSTPLESAGVVFTLSVYSTGPERCLLYRENQTKNLTDSKGTFSLTLGSGTRSDGGAHSFTQAFTNAGTLGGLTCAVGNSYAPTATQDRSLVVSFVDGGTTVDLAAQEIKSVPFAMQAHQISGYGISNLLRVSGIGSTQNLLPGQVDQLAALPATPCANNDILKFNGTAWTCGTDNSGAVIGDASYIAKGVVQLNTDAATSGLIIAAGVISVNAGTGNNQIVKLDGTGKLPAVDGSALTGMTATNLTGVVPVANGGTNSNTALTNDRLMISNGGKIVEAAAMTNGQIVVGKTGAAPQLVTLSGDVSVDNTGVSTIGAIGGKVFNGTFAASDKIMYYDSTSNKMEIVGMPTCGASEYLTFNGTAYSCVADAGAAGSVTSVAAGAHPITISGTGTAPVVNFNYDSAQFDLSTNLFHLKAGGIGNAEIAAAAAIARTKLANGTANHVLINDGTGVMSSEANLAISRGGTGAGTKTAGFDALSPNSAKGDLTVHNGTNNVRLPTGTDAYVLTADAAQASGLKWAALPAAPVDASYAAKGIVQFDTNAATSGMTVAAGVATVNKGGGIGQIAQVGGVALAPNGAIIANATGTALLSLNCTIGQVMKFDASGFAICGADNGTTGTGTQNQITKWNDNLGALTDSSLSDDGTTVTVAANKNLAMASGTGTSTQTYTGTGTAQTITANSLTSGNILSLTSNSTAAAAGNNGLNVAVSGANGTATITRYGLKSAVTATGATSTNVAGYFSASGATNNYAMIVNTGKVGVGIATPFSNTMHLGKSAAPTVINEANTYLHLGGTESAAGSHRLIGFGYSYSTATNFPAYMGYLTTDITTFEKGALVFGTRDVVTDTIPTERMRIDTTGNIGIGTTGPLDTFSIGTAPVASATRSQVNLSNTALVGGSANGTYISANPAAFTGNFLEFQVGGVSKAHIDATGKFYGDGSGLSNISGAISGLTAGNIPKAGSATTIVDSVISETGGNIGIGISPTAKLHVNGNTQIDGNLMVTASNIGWFNLQHAVLSNGTTAAGAYTSVVGSAAVDGYLELVSTGGVGTTDYIRMAVGNDGATEAIRIIHSGYVGIGITNPTAPLYVKKTGIGTNSIFESTCDGCGSNLNVFNAGPTISGTTYSSVDFSINSTADVFGRVSGIATSGVNGALSFSTTNGGTLGEKMRIDNAGNVGIGVTGPTNKLEVAGNIRQTAGQFSNAPYNNGAAVAFNLNNGNIQYTSANCQAMTLSNMQDGGTYTIVVKGTTTGTCSFTGGGYNYWYSPAMGSSASGSMSSYTFVRVGNDVMVTWISLYQ